MKKRKKTSRHSIGLAGYQDQGERTMNSTLPSILFTASKNFMHAGSCLHHCTMLFSTTPIPINTHTRFIRRHLSPSFFSSTDRLSSSQARRCFPIPQVQVGNPTVVGHGGIIFFSLSSE